MKYLDGSVVQLSIHGEGSRSGATETVVLYVTKAFLEEHRELWEEYTPWFSELDGKHSECKGDKFEEVLTKENAKELLASGRGLDEYQIVECVFWEFMDEATVFHQEFIKLIEVKTVVEVVLDGEVV